MTKDEIAIHDCQLFTNRTLDKCEALRDYIDNCCGRTGVHAECKRRLRAALGEADEACHVLKACKEALK